MMSSSNNDEENDNEMGVAYTTGDEYFHGNNLRTLSTTNPVDYLEYLAKQEQYSPQNLSSHRDSLPSQSLIPSRAHYVMSPDDNPQRNQINTITNNNNNNDNYNPYFYSTEQQIHNNKEVSTLSPLDEVVNSDSYQIEMINDDVNRQIYQQSQSYQPHQPHQPQQSRHFQQQSQQQFPTEYIDNSNIPMAVNPSSLALPGLSLTRNRSRISTPKIEKIERIPSAYTAQVHQSDSPLRTEFRNDSFRNDSDASSEEDVKSKLGEILNKDRLTNLNNFRSKKVERDSNESSLRFDFHNAHGDPDDPLLNNINTRIPEEERQLPTGLLNGNININNYNGNGPNNINIIPHQSSKYSQPVSPISTISPTSQIAPIIPAVLIDDNEREEANHDVIKIGPDKEVKVHKPNQGTIFMLLATFVLASFIFVTWMLSDLGIGDAREIYNIVTNKGILSMYPPGTEKKPPIRR